MTKIRFEFMLTLECHWGCNDCCRGLEKGYPPDSHVTPEQIERFIQHLKDKQIFVSRLKVNGGDPVHNPDFEKIIGMFAGEVPSLFAKIKVQTAYPSRAIKAKYSLPKSIHLRCEPVDDKNYKSHHVPWFVSPYENEILGSSGIPPQGTALTGKTCPLQSRCGRSFERWGFTACAEEAVLGRMLGIPVHKKEYKPWGAPEICRHCPMCLGQIEAKKLQQRAIDGEIPFVSRCFQDVNLETVYSHMSLKPW